MRMSDPSDLLVYEYFSGGGFLKGNPESGIALEALSMLWAILTDFRNWGDVRTVTVLDPRFENYASGWNRSTFPADEIVRATPEVYEDIFLSSLERCDTALIVAPETDGILSGLSALVESAGKKLLGSNSRAVAMAGDKENCNGIFLNANLPTPETRVIHVDFLDALVEQSKLPLVVKPVNGIGSEGVCLIEDIVDIPKMNAHIRSTASQGNVLIQPFVDGFHTSVSLLVAEGRSVPLSLNRQLIYPGIPFEYRGSVVPFECEKGRYAMDLACSAVGQIEGLSGYVGVDMVITEDSVQLMEINPRLTTSYVGLRQAAGVNPAGLIYEACVYGTLPDSIPLTGRFTVLKDDPATWGLAD